MKGRVEIIVGAQWGDEGKGRVVDAIANNMDVVVRFQGGANAGHTVIVEGEKYIFHLLPSGMLYSGKTCVVGNGVVVDPQQLLEELGDLQERGKDRARLVISGAAHVVMPYHKVLDGMEERLRGSGKKIGTTRRGIGPCYMDKVNRCGIRVEDLLCEDALREKLSFNLEIKNMHLTRIYGEAPMAFGEIFDQARVWGEKLGPYVGDASLTIFEALVNGNNVLFEGAQGTLLDLDHGTYPFVTSSSPVAGGACVGAGLGPSLVGRVTGVVKAYCTRVGEGPFPTEHRGKSGDVLRERGGEFGATTGRPRRCGWLDLVALKYAVRVNGIHALALTKLDVLSGFETIPVCVSYRSDEGENLPFKGNLTFLDSVEPVFRNMDGWKRDLGECRSFDDLPRAARDYIRFIEEETGVPVVLVGVGPSRDQTIVRGL
ncbi:MAG: adenylosuccinate synthase [Thermovirgaceae bacterium]|jgi:adenylosuccinate synthase|nr:adenylosuccinate synthase [Synergistales bacterium]MDI9393485.1 adenylosuccinate synthase [Synergistota bacterium]MDY0178985.1 adenylosuccinate synthase [Synergistaceae bacterium]HRW87320.1 adenylosuccinate synthase [Thermovirgaceae bacterium]MDD3133694.1 adenylosuccinate synthase [Synergistales bacterium]